MPGLLYFYPRPPRGGRRSTLNVGECPSVISIHALREEGDGVIHLDRPRFIVFLSTPSARRATTNRRNGLLCREISIHALREEGDLEQVQQCGRLKLFLSTPSARRATAVPNLYGQQPKISIHALREEGDQRTPTAIT